MHMHRSNRSSLPHSIRRGMIAPAVIAMLVGASAGCSKTNDATTAGTTPATAPGTTLPAKNPGTTATTANGTVAPPTSAAGSTVATKPAAPNQVTISNFLFAPATLEVKAGTEVVWANQDNFDHWVLADDKTSFDSKTLGEAATYAHTFTIPGTYPYFCNIHNQMKGAIVVS